MYIPGIYKQRNKTFFFFNYEGHRHNAREINRATCQRRLSAAATFPRSWVRNIGTDALGRPILAGQIYDPYSTQQVNATCAVPNADPSKAIAVGQLVWIRNPIAGNNLANSVNGIDPVGQALVKFYPQPNANTSSGNWAASGLGGNNSDEYSARIDHNFSDSTRLYGRYSYKKEFKDVPGIFWIRQSGRSGTKEPK